MPDPIQTAYRQQMREVARTLDVVFNGTAANEPGRGRRKVAFVLLTAEFDKVEDGRVNYISNGDRADIVAMMKELIARFEGQPEQSGHA